MEHNGRVKSIAQKNSLIEKINLDKTKLLLNPHRIGILQRFVKCQKQPNFHKLLPNGKVVKQSQISIIV